VQDWFVYVLRCADDTLYTGVARDVAARIAQHEAGKGARYTRGRGPLALLAKMRCAGQSEAQRIEARVKSLSRDEKLALVRRIRRSARSARISLLEGLRCDASC
jgi:putative endonuclease